MLTKTPEEALGTAVQNLLDMGCIKKPTGDTKMGQWENMEITSFGEKIIAYEFEDAVTRLLLIGNLLLIQETAVIVGSQIEFLKRDIYREDDNVLATSVDKMKWSDGSPSDDVSLVNMFRAWRASPHITRADGGRKKFVAHDVAIRRPHEDQISGTQPWELFCVGHNVLPKMADNTFEMIETMIRLNADRYSACVYVTAKNANKSIDELEIVMKPFTSV
jgi:hypothetical protein